MRGGERWLPALGIGVVALQLAGMTGAYGLVLCFASPVVAALVSRKRFESSVPGEMLLLIGCGAAGFLVTTIVPLGTALGSEPMRPAPAALAMAALLFAGLRLHLGEPQWGLAGTFGIGLAAFLACGTVQSGRLFPAALFAYGVLAFGALAASGVSRGERQSRRRLDRRHALASALLLVLVAGLTSSLAGAIPALYHAAYHWALRMVDHRTVSGFHDGALQLGALHGMLQSDEVVARVEGEAGSHLRGNVYQIYRRGRWLPGDGSRGRAVRAASITPPGAGEAPIQTRIRYTGEGLDRFFLPLIDGQLQLDPVNVRVDDLGVVRTTADESAQALVLLPGDAAPVTLAPASDLDRGVPESIAPALAALVESWVEGRVDATDRIDALRLQLESRYVYSLEVQESDDEASGRADPLLGFLLDRRAGHCEYFASAMTLLARSAGLPARLVTGYRVAEHNPYGDYAIVRERHAHAWSEIYIEGEGWVTVDPSPLLGSSLAASDRTAMLAGLFDYAGVLAGDWGTEALLVVLVLGLAGLQIRRLISERDSPADADAAEAGAAPAHLAALLGWLAENGVVRPAHEPLEAFARRIHRIEPAAPIESESLHEASLLLQRYTAFRYGGVGSGELLQRDVSGWLEQQRA